MIHKLLIPLPGHIYAGLPVSSLINITPSLLLFLLTKDSRPQAIRLEWDITIDISLFNQYSELQYGEKNGRQLI